MAKRSKSNGKLSKSNGHIKVGRPKGAVSRFTPAVVKDLTKKLLKWIEQPDSYWLGSFATANGMYRTQLNELASKDEGFSEAFKIALSVQEERIAKGAIEKRFDTVFSIFTLKNVAGWRDQRDLAVSGEVKFINHIPEPDFEGETRGTWPSMRR